MNRPWKIWLAFACCSVLLFCAMAWVSAMILRLDREQALARAQADLEEKVRLALWRMDSMLSPILVQESARPHLAYSAFVTNSGILAPSPLLTDLSSNVLLHFQFDPEGRLTSPQAPTGAQRALAMRFATEERIGLAAERLREFERMMAQAPAASAGLGGLESNRELLLAAAPPSQSAAAYSNFSPVLNPALEQQLQNAPAKNRGVFDSLSQSTRSTEELQARAQSVKQAYDVTKKSALVANQLPAGMGETVEGLFKPLWFGEALILVRRASVQGRQYAQGCWMDWAGLKAWLLGSIGDLLPNARLEPILTDDAQARLLVSLPVRLIPAPQPFAPAPLSPIRIALFVAWSCVLFAGVAIGLLLGGTLGLSERRADFVSAVTHELRTPLTTFKMYSEMLATGMAPESSRNEYFSTLCAEANRLSHLVENVLAYARLERGSARSRAEQLTLRELVDRAKPRLVQRAAQAGMMLEEDFGEGALETRVEVDAAAVEQILFNLVDNACKYAGQAEGKIIHLEAFPENDRRAMLRVRDHGQGISSEAAKRLFQPFSKSAAEAARTAPGVGLGLALSRRLARNLGGDLRLSAGATSGACFELLLPCV